MRRLSGVLTFALLGATLAGGAAQAQGWRGRPTTQPTPAPPPPAPPPPPPPVAPPPPAPGAIAPARPGAPSGTGRLRNAARGMCLDVAGWSAQGNFDVLLWECNEDPDQVWTFAPGGELRDTLTGQCLDVAGYDGAKGADVGTYRCEGQDDQHWMLAARPNGQFEIRNAKRGLCLDVVGRAGNRGDNVLLWACDGGVDQLWTFEPYNLPGRQRPYRHQTPPPPMPEMVPPPPPAPPPPPPAPPQQRDPAWRRHARPMDEPAFRRLVGAVKNEGFSDNQLNVIESASGRNYFRVTQLRALLDSLSFSATKLRALELVAPRLVDPENTFAVYDAFTFSADKEQARQILKRCGY